MIHWFYSGPFFLKNLFLKKDEILIFDYFYHSFPAMYIFFYNSILYYRFIIFKDVKVLEVFDVTLFNNIETKIEDESEWLLNFYKKSKKNYSFQFNY